MIELTDCTKLFGKSLALNAINLRFDGTGLTLLLGSNGAGKSTLLRACAGLLTPSSGTVKSQAALSYFGHQLMLYPQLSVAENLDFFSALNPGSQEFCSQSMTEEQWLDIDSLNSKLVEELSQGQKARVGLARVLKNSKDKTLLLDEPSAAFDRHWQKLFIEKLQLYCRDRLIILVTHDPERYIDFASRAIILVHGAVLHDVTLNSEERRTALLNTYSEVLR